MPTLGCTLGLSTHLLVDAHRGGELAIFLVFSRFHALADRPIHRWIGMLGAQGSILGSCAGAVVAPPLVPVPCAWAKPVVAINVTAASATIKRWVI
jgi:hypothetical protein